MKRLPPLRPGHCSLCEARIGTNPNCPRCQMNARAPLTPEEKAASIRAYEAERRRAAVEKAARVDALRALGRPIEVVLLPTSLPPRLRALARAAARAQGDVAYLVHGIVGWELLPLDAEPPEEKLTRRRSGAEYRRWALEVQNRLVVELPGLPLHITLLTRGTEEARVAEAQRWLTPLWGTSVLDAAARLRAAARPAAVIEKTQAAVLAAPPPGFSLAFVRFFLAEHRQVLLGAVRERLGWW